MQEISRHLTGFSPLRDHRLHRRALLLPLLGAVILLLGVATAEAGKKKAPTGPHADLPGHVNFLAQKLYGEHLDDAAPITDEIRKLVLGHLEQWMANRTPSDVDVRRQLESAFSKLHYPLFGKPAVFEEPWKGGMVLGAGYTLGWSDYNRVNVVALFESREGKSHLAAVTSFIPRTDIHYEILPRQENDDLRFFVYGFRLGKSQLRLSAVYYAFDGQSLKSLWDIHDAYDGKMEVQGDKLIIRYLNESEYIREVAHNRYPPRHESVYLITPTGLQLQTEREIPF
jgi:hypothetical protein